MSYAERSIWSLPKPRKHCKRVPTKQTFTSKPSYTLPQATSLAIGQVSQVPRLQQPPRRVGAEHPPAWIGIQPFSTAIKGRLLAGISGVEFRHLLNVKVSNSCSKEDTSDGQGGIADGQSAPLVQSLPLVAAGAPVFGALSSCHDLLLSLSLPLVSFLLCNRSSELSDLWTRPADVTMFVGLRGRVTTFEPGRLLLLDT